MTYLLCFIFPEPSRYVQLAWIFLVDRSAIGIILSFVCLSVRLSVTLFTVATRVDVEDLKLCNHVPRAALPIYFFRHFCGRMYRSAKTRSERLKRRNFCVCSVVTWLWLFQTRHFGGSVRRSAFLATARPTLLVCASLYVDGWSAVATPAKIVVQLS